MRNKNKNKSCYVSMYNKFKNMYKCPLDGDSDIFCKPKLPSAKRRWSRRCLSTLAFCLVCSLF